MRRPFRANHFSRYRRPLAATVIYALFFQLVLPAAPLTRPVALPMRLLFAAQAAATAAMAPAALANEATVVLHDVVTGANDIAALEHEPSSNHLLAAVEGGQTALATVDSDGAPHPFSSLASVDEPIVATSRATGDVFVAASGSSVIARVKSGGKTVVTPWATLPNAAIADLHVDGTGAWGGDVIAVTTTGAVWRLDANAQAKLVANIGVAPAGVTTIAVDAGRYGPWSGAIVVGARASATLHAIDAAGVVKAFTIGVTPRDLTVAAAHENFYGIDRAAGKIRGARGDAFAQMSGELVVAQHSPGVLARVRWDGTTFVTTKIAEGGKWDRVAFSPAGVGAIPPARRIYDAVAVVRHAPVLTGGRVEGALWQLTAENLTLDGTDVITSDLLVPGTPKVVVESGKPSFNGVIQGSDRAEPTGYTITIQGNAALRHVINRTDAMTLASVIPPPAPAGTRDVSLSAAGETPGNFATLRNLSLSGKVGDVTVPPGTYGRFSATGRTALILGTAGATSAAIYNMERLELAGGAELRVAGPTVINLRDGATVTGASAGAINAPGQLVLNVAGGEVQVLGTGVLAALVRVPSGAVSIDGTGLLRGTVGADRLSVSGNGVLQVTQNDVPPPQVNRPPSVGAGADQTITLPDNALRLEGSVSDDGLPHGSSLAVSWSVVEGAGVSFSDSGAAITTATFAAPGTYVLRLTANDSALRTTDDVTITVLPENKPPVVQAGADQRIELPATAALAGVATDDGLPAGSSLKTTWNRVSGPGSVTFDDASKAVARATFSIAGVYTLRLTATDGEESASDDVTITVDPANEAPVVSAGDDQFIVLPSTATLSGTASDDGSPHGSTLATQWTKVSGAGVVTFADAAKPATVATFASAGIYVLRLTATDGRETRSDDVTLTVDPVNQAPVVSAGSNATLELPHPATLRGTVSDDGWPRGSKVTQQWSVVSGTGVSFADATAVATTATFATAGTYVLRLTATDGDASASADVTITVHPENQAPVVNAGADATVRLPSAVALSGSASDDGAPFGSKLTTTWSKVSGAGSVTFADASALSTTAAFSAAGTYVLRLTASDTRATVSDDVTVVVLPANQAPAANAGADATASAGANLVRNGGGEALGTDGSVEEWIAASGLFTRVENGAAEGAAYLRATGASEVRQEVEVVALPQGTSFELSAFVRGAARIVFEFRGASGTLLDTFEANAQPSAGWTAVTDTRAGPAGTASIRVRLIASGEASFDAVSIRAPGIATTTLLGTISDDGLPAGNTLAASWSTVSGPAAVVFADATQATTTAAFAKPGTYVLRLTVTDGELSASDEVSIAVSSANQPPVVDAGGPQSVRLPATVTLAGRASDDQLPAGSVLAISWTAVSGADSVTLAGASTLTPTVTFGKAGTYVLRLTVSDSELTIHDDVTITVAAANHPPVVNAGADATITLPAPASLSGSASDEDDDTVTLKWSVVSGGPVTFANANSASTTATFAAAGTYVLRLTATDGELSVSDDVAITVRPEPVNQAPVVDAGEPQTVGVGEQAELHGTATDDGLPATGALSVVWTAVSGPGQVTFANAKAAETTATFSAAGTYKLRLTATDSALSASDETTVTVLQVPVAAFTTAGGARYAGQWNNNVASINEGAAIVSTSSSASASEGGEKALDDDPHSRWTSASGQATNQFIVVDLAGTDPVLIDRVRIINSTGLPSVRGFRIDVSTTTADAAAFTTVATGTLSDIDRVQELAFTPVQARYVRFFAINSRSATTLALASFEVIAPKRGGIASYLAPPVVGRAVEGTIVTSTSSGSASLAIDDYTSYWSGVRSPAPTAELALPQTYRIDRVRLTNLGEPATRRSTRNIRIEVSLGESVPTVWTTVLETTLADVKEPQVFALPGGAVDARIVRVTLLSNYGDPGTTELRQIEFLTAPGPVPSVSSYQPFVRPENLLDGSSTTSWQTLAGRVAGEYVTLALGEDEPQLIDGVALAAHTDTAALKDFEVLVSSTTEAPDAFRTVLTGTLVNDSKLHEFAFPAGPIRARFVKLIARSNYGGTLLSLGTFFARAVESAGNLISAPMPLAPTRHLSPAHSSNGATATASSGQPAPMLDFAWDFGTWATTNKTSQWAKIDLAGDAVHQISGVIIGPRLNSATMPADGPKDFEIWVSSTTADDASFSKVFSGTVTQNAFNRFEFPTVGAKFIKYVPLTSQGTSTSISTAYFDVISNAGGAISWSSHRDTFIGAGAIDGNRSTQWLTSGTSNEWLIYALPGHVTHKVFGVHIDPYGSEGPKQFEIRVSNTTADPSAFTTVFTGTSTDSSARPYYFDRTVDARYVQFYWKTTSGSWTIGVFDVGVLTMPKDGATVIGLSSTAQPHVPITSLIDANPRNTEWRTANGGTTNQFVTVALPLDGPYLIDHVALEGVPLCCANVMPRNFEIQVSMEDGAESTFRTVYHGTMRSQPTHPQLVQHFFFPATPARHVRLLVRNNWGHTATMWLRSLWVFSPQVGSTTARFIDASSEADAIVSWEWDFGDGGRSSERDPVHEYARPGLYDVRLTVRDARSNSSTFTVPYRAEGGPVADFTFAPTPSNEGTTVTFTDRSSSNLGELTNQRWIWQDGTADTFDTTPAPHHFDDSGTYAVTHTVANARGITATATKDVTVLNLPPRADAGPDLKPGWGDDWAVSPVYFDASIADRNTLLCRWDFGDGETLDHPNCYGKPAAKHAYAAPGTYTATLTLIDKDGGTHSDTLVVVAGPRKTAIRYTGSREIAPGQPMLLAAVLTDAGHGAALANRQLVFTSEGQSATATTDANGHASVSLPYLGAEENPTITVTFAGEPRYEKSTVATIANCALNPQWLDIALVFDVSGSMADPLANAQAAARDFLAQIKPNDAVTVVDFAEYARVQSPLSLDRTAATQAINALGIRGGTRVESGIDVGREELLGARRRPSALPVLVLLSDGETDHAPAIAAAEKAKAAGIRIVSIVLNNIPAGMELMRKVASPGDYYVATKSDELRNIYASIVGTLCTPPNRPPVVIAPAAQTLVLPQSSVVLDATVRDDALPAYSTVTTTWSKVSGPGNVTFANASSVDTTASFDASGTYVLRLSANDTQYTRTDDVTIAIKENTAPVVDAGSDRAIGLPPGTLNLNGTAADETVPAGVTLTTLWSVTSGGGTVTFADASALATTATFSAVGTYTLKLTATDSLVTSSDELVVTVVANDAPVVSAGADQRIALGANLLLNGGNDEPLTAGAIRGWSPVSGTWSRPAAGTNGLPSALRGDSYFYAGNDASAELRQDVDVSALASRIDAGQQQFAWSAFAHNAAEPVADTADVIIEYRNAGNTAVLAAHAVELTAAQWTEGEGTNTAPAGTRWIRVRLAAARGSGATTDVFMDAVSLRAVAAAQTTLAGSATDDGVPQPLQTTWSVVSGTGAVTFGDSTSSTSTAVANTAGDYTLRLTANDGSSVISDDMLLTVAAANGAPSVNAGSDAEVRLPSTATLTAIVTDGSGPAPIALRWELLSGPETVTFSDAKAASTVVTFTKGGQYRFRVTADDSDEIAFDTVTINVLSSSGNAAPTVDAGTDALISPPSTSATLNATVSDDGLPTGSTLTTTWSQASGAGTATFSDATSRTPAVTFDRHGIYVLRTSATDGELTTTDEVTVRYDGTNQAPAVDAGADQTARLNTPANLAATITDDNLPLGAALSLTWTKVSGPGLVTFSANTSATTTATFSETGTYVLRLTANDSALSTSDEVTVTVEPAVPAPTVEITSPEDGSTITQPTVFIGHVSEGATWRLEYRLNGSDKDAGDNLWVPIASGVGPVNGPLGTFDPTILVNGTYKVRLAVTGSDGQTRGVSVSAAVDGHLKVGLFTVTFNDLSVPMAGIPLGINRTYDSRDRRRGDFGHGWRLALRSVRVEKSGVAGTGWIQTRSAGSFPTYCLTSTMPRFISITMPNNEVQRFRVAVSPSCQSLAPIRTAAMVFEAVGDTKMKLVDAADSTMLVEGAVPGEVQLVDAGLEPYDPTAFKLTAEDGSVFHVNVADGLRKVIEPDGHSLTISADAVTHSSGKSIQFHRDSSGRITKMTDPAGNDRTYTYDARGDLVRVVDQTARATTFTYDATHGLLEYFDAAGRRGVKNEYDAVGRLIAMTDSAGQRTAFSFNPTTRQEVITTRRGRTLVQSYDAAGRIVSISDGTRETKATYDAAGNMLTWTDWLGRVSKFTYDANGRMLTSTDPESNTTAWTYDNRGQVTSVKNPNGDLTTFEFDARGTLVSVTDPRNAVTRYGYDAEGRRNSETYPDGTVHRFTHDTHGNVIEDIDEAGNVTRFTYDAMGRQTSVTSPRGLTTTTSYDAAGRKLSQTSAAGTTTWEYDPAGELKAVVDQTGTRTEFATTAAGLPSGATYADQSTWSMTYDAAGTVSASSRTGLAPTAYTRDARGNITSLVIDGSARETYEVDAEGRRTKVTDARGNATRYELNARNQITLMTDALQNTQRFEFDAVGNRTKMTDQRGHTTSFRYDERGRLLTAQNADGRTTAFAWNDLNELARIERPDGSTREFTYDATGRLDGVLLAGSMKTAYVYDGDGNLSSVTDALQRQTTLEYDTTNALSKRTFPDGSAEQFIYEQGMPVRVVDRAGRSTSFKYDVMGRMSEVTAPDGSVTKFTYTAAGQRDTVTDANGSVDYDYTTDGRISRITRSDGVSISYEYDAQRNRTAVITAAGTTRYAYDELNRVSTVVDPRGRTTSYRYDATGNPIEVRYPNGWVTTRTFDPMNRPSTVSTSNAAGTVVFSESYERDPNGNAKKITYEGGRSVSYAYDALDRLTSEVYYSSDGTITRRLEYTYDGVGNRLTLTDSARSTELRYSYDAVDTLQSDGVSTYLHDASGSLREVSTAEGVTKYAYDAQNRLASATLPDGRTATFAYGADGPRSSTTTAAGQTRYVVDQNTRFGRTVMELDASGSAVASYVYGNDDAVVSAARGGEEYFYIYDGGGSVRALVDSAGNVTDTYAYTAYGELRERSGSTPNPFLYRGEAMDAETGLYYLRARYYDPSTGRFLSMDTYDGSLQEPQSRHRYVYATNNPVENVDPCGRCSTRATAGTVMHRAIQAWYRYTWGLICEDLFLERVIAKDEQTGTGIGKKRGGMGRFCDMSEDCLGEVFEIKPLSPDGVRDAAWQAANYARSLNATIGMFAPGGGNGVWYHNGMYTFYDPPADMIGLEVHGPRFHQIYGAVFYAADWDRARENLRKKQLEMVPALVPVAQPQVSYGYANSSLRVQNILNAATGLILAAAIVGLGIVMTRIALSSRTLGFA